MHDDVAGLLLVGSLLGSMSVPLAWIASSFRSHRVSSLWVLGLGAMLLAIAATAWWRFLFGSDADLIVPVTSVIPLVQGLITASLKVVFVRVFSRRPDEFGWVLSQMRPVDALFHFLCVAALPGFAMYCILRYGFRQQI